MLFDFILKGAKPDPAESFLVVRGRHIPLVMIRSSRARRYLLALRADGSARLTIPRRGSAREGRDSLWQRDRPRPRSRRGSAPVDRAASLAAGGQGISAQGDGVGGPTPIDRAAGRGAQSTFALGVLLAARDALLELETDSDAAVCAGLHHSSRTDAPAADESFAALLGRGEKGLSPIPNRGAMVERTLHAAQVARRFAFHRQSDKN